MDYWGPHIKIKGKVLNWFGAIYVIQALALGVIWSLSMSVLHVVCKLTGWDPNRKWYDWTGKQWVRAPPRRIERAHRPRWRTRCRARS